MITYTYKQLKQILKGVSSPHGKDVYAVCPKCGHSEFGISLREGNVFGCFRKKKCGWTGNIYTLLSFLGISYTIEKAISNHIPEIRERGLREVVDTSLSPVIFPPLRSYVKENSYLSERGFSNYNKYEIWQNKLNTDHIYFTIPQNGIPVAFVGRLLPDKEGLRYNNSKCEYRKIVFGYDEIIPEITDTVIITEGVFDKFKVEDSLNLDFNNEIKCVCTFRSAISKEQIFLLKQKGVKNIYLMYEPDVPKSVLKASTVLRENFDSVKLCQIPEGKDPNTMTKKEIEDSFNCAEDFLSCGHKTFAGILRQNLENVLHR